jgi:hypothetical protein
VEFQKIRQHALSWVEKDQLEMTQEKGNISFIALGAHS